MYRSIFQKLPNKVLETNRVVRAMHTKGVASMLKCTILNDYQKAALSFANWSSLRPAVTVNALHNHFASEHELIKAVYDQDILVIMRERTLFNESVFSKLPNLKLLITSGMRNAAIDLDAAAKHGVTVCGTRNLSEPAGELTWALILGLARNLKLESNSLQMNGPWQSTVGLGLSGKQLGLLGLGKIGLQVAKIGEAFGMNVVAWSQNLTKEKADVAGIALAPSKEDLLESSDFVSVHLVLSERTKDLIRAADIARMRPSAYLINTSRGPIVNEADLIQALQEQRIAGAGLDVFEVEPLSTEHPFRTLPNVLATPHLGYVTKENYEIYFKEALENITAYLQGSCIRVLSNPNTVTFQSKL